jgi:hypothetical protein
MLDNKNSKQNTNKIPLISDKSLALAVKIQKKFNNDENVYDFVNEFIDNLNVDCNGYFELAPFWEKYLCEKQKKPCSCETHKKSDWIDIFNAYFDEPKLLDEINRYISFSNRPYLIMSKNTLLAFEELATNSVYIEHDCENGIICADYINDKTTYKIVIDNDLGFGVVKVR